MKKIDTLWFPNHWSDGERKLEIESNLVKKLF